MTVVKLRPALAEIKSLLGSDKEFLMPLVRTVLQEVLDEVEVKDALGAAKDERVEGRLGYCSGHYSRSLVTRIGNIELRVPQDRQGRFSTELFERHQRSEKGINGDVHTGRFHAQGEGHHRGADRPFVFGLLGVRAARARVRARRVL